MSQYPDKLHDFPFFSQNDNRWNGIDYGNGGNIGSSGCGPTAAAMVLKSYGFDVTPSETAKLFTKAMGGYQTTDGPTCFPVLERSPFNLTVKNSHSINEVITALTTGIPVIANPQGPCDFTLGGHYIVLCGISGSNQIFVNDPNGRNYEACSTRLWSADYINKHCCGSNVKDGFWIISRSGGGSIGKSAARVKRYTDFPKYNLSESMIRFIAGVIVGECSGTVLGCRQEASQMVNLNESKGRSHDDAGMKQTVKRFSEGGWYEDKSFNASPTQTAIDAVRSVMIEGRRVLPRYVVEHDWFPHDIINAKSKSAYSVGDIVKNNSGSTYRFYCFFDGPEGDIAGYFPSLYEQYKDDVPWSEGGDNEEYLYSENSYAEEEKEPTVVWNNRVQENIMPAMDGVPVPEPTGEFKLYANGIDITSYAGGTNWKNSIYELSTILSFETAKSDAAYLKDLVYVPQVGDIVQIVTNGEVFRGVIKDVDDGGKDSNKYTVIDKGWYLNKTSQTYQFKNITAADAIKELCADLVIPIVMLPELTENINEIYFDKTISAILTDILDKCGGGYNYDFTPQGLRIYKIGELAAYPEFRIAENIPQTFAINYRGEVSHSLSIEDMINSVKVTSEKDKVYTELKVLQNRELIDKYGFLQKIVKIDPEKENPDETAQKELEEHAKINESFGMTIIEKYDSYTRAGEIINIDDAQYVIESTDHSLKGGIHYNKMQLKKI